MLLKTFNSKDFFRLILVIKYFSILKYFSRFWNIFLNSEVCFSIPKYSVFQNFSSILKAFSRLWKFFLDFESFSSMAVIGHHSTAFVSYFNPLLSEKRFFPVETKCLGQTPTVWTYFWPMFPISTPWKHQKTKSFLVFSGRIKWDHLPEMG